MILLLGASGYVGEAFATELRRRKTAFTPLSRREMDYSQFDVLLKFLREHRPAFVINAAGYIGKPNVDACENAKAETLLGNVVLPVTIAHACLEAGVPWYRSQWMQTNLAATIQFTRSTVGGLDEIRGSMGVRCSC